MDVEYFCTRSSSSQISLDVLYTQARVVHDPKSHSLKVVWPVAALLEISTFSIFRSRCAMGGFWACM